MPKTQEEIYKELMAKLEPDAEKGVMPLLRMLASMSLQIPTGAMPSEPARSKSVNTRIPDTAKLRGNMERNELMAQFPGLGAR